MGRAASFSERLTRLASLWATWHTARVSSTSTHAFALDPRLAADTVALGESDLSLLLLMNERRYPWLILVPKRADVSELTELDPEERSALLEEAVRAGDALRALYAVDKINLGALGNVVRQLHVHVVGRRVSDAAWPGPVWGHSPREPCGDAELARVRADLAGSALRERFTFGRAGVRDPSGRARP